VLRSTAATGFAAGAGFRLVVAGFARSTAAAKAHTTGLSSCGATACGFVALRADFLAGLLAALGAAFFAAFFAAFLADLFVVLPADFFAPF
jgi:hypothetical protein